MTTPNKNIQRKDCTVKKCTPERMRGFALILKLKRLSKNQKLSAVKNLKLLNQNRDNDETISIGK